MTITLRCEAGGHFGIGHAMRLRTIAQALHALDPTVPIQVLGASPALDSIFAPCQPWAPVYLGVNYNAHDVLVVDLRQDVWNHAAAGLCTIQQRWHVHVVGIDAPWATPDTCNTLILPGLHHSQETLTTLRQSFGENLHSGADYTVLPRGYQQYVPFASRKNHIVFSAGGSDPREDLRQMYTLTYTLDTLIPDIERWFVPGRFATPWNESEHPLKHIAPANTLHLHATAGLAVVMWGITAYECLRAQTPTLIIPQDAARAADALRAQQATGGALQTLHCLDSYTPTTFSQAIADLWHNTAERQYMHDAGFRLVDDAGAERIAQILLAQYHKGA